MSVLFHYCSNNTFLSIIENKCVWLSSLSLSNDSMEGKIIKQILSDLCKENGITELEREQVISYIQELEDNMDGLGFCLSEDGDLLSQWRGYADDASGIAIGFSKEYLELLSKKIKKHGFKLHKVNYDSSKQRKVIQPIYDKITKHIKSRTPNLMTLAIGTKADKSQIKNYKLETIRLSIQTLVSFVTKIFSFKSQAFSEEKEWRLLAYSIKPGEKNCNYYSRGDYIVPYRKFALEDVGCSPIKEVILGPRNLTPIHVIENILASSGFIDVTVRKSIATYR